MIFKKLVYFSIVVGSLPQVTEAVEHSMGVLPRIVVVCAMLIVYMPELFLLHGGYRKWVKGAIENQDGEFNRDDARYFISWYGPFICLRTLVFTDLYGKLDNKYEADDTLIWALVAIATGTALPQIKQLFGK